MGNFQNCFYSTKIPTFPSHYRLFFSTNIQALRTGCGKIFAPKMIHNPLLLIHFTVIFLKQTD